MLCRMRKLDFLPLPILEVMDFLVVRRTLFSIVKTMEVSNDAKDLSVGQARVSKCLRSSGFEMDSET